MTTADLAFGAYTVHYLKGNELGEGSKYNRIRLQKIVLKVCFLKLISTKSKQTIYKGYTCMFSPNHVHRDMRKFRKLGLQNP